MSVYWVFLIRGRSPSLHNKTNNIYPVYTARSLSTQERNCTEYRLSHNKICKLIFFDKSKGCLAHNETICRKRKSYRKAR